ncbi:recombinase family protein [Actinomadura physcomitrii]
MGENVRRSERTKRWHAAQAQRGIPHTGGRTFGYRLVDGAPGAIEVVPEEAAVIRAAVAACAEGRSWGAMTDIFARSGLPTGNGGPWRTQTVKQIISSPRLAGLRMLDGEIVIGPNGSPVLGCWEPIISRAEWEAVRARYEPRRRAPGGRSLAGNGRTPRKYLLSGFLLCGKEADGRRRGCVMAGCATKQDVPVCVPAGERWRVRRERRARRMDRGGGDRTRPGLARHGATRRPEASAVGSGSGTRCHSPQAGGAAGAPSTGRDHSSGVPAAVRRPR